MLNKPFLSSTVRTGVRDTPMSTFPQRARSLPRLTCFITFSARWLDNVLHNMPGTLMLWECSPLTVLPDRVTEALEQQQPKEQKNAAGGGGGVDV